MVEPIIAYGHNILRTKCEHVSDITGDINYLINNLWQTLEKSGGVGLASPQINNKYNVFVVNSYLMYENLSNSERKELFSKDKGIKETFINAKIIDKSEEKWSEVEGCLSIPGIVESVDRSWDIIVEYYDSDFNKKKHQYSGYTAKVIQHEYDHTNGVLFIDHLSSLNKKLVNNKLKHIINGKVKVDYPIQYIKRT